MQTARQALGTWGEFQVFRALQKKGYCPTFSPYRKSGDIHFQRYAGAMTTRVEVKTSSWSEKYACFRFCLHKRGFTSHYHSDYVVLVCVDAIGMATYLVIHTSEIRHIKHITITDIAKSKYAKYERNINEVAKWLNA